jgi:hypothetical protein
MNSTRSPKVHNEGSAWYVSCGRPVVPGIRQSFRFEEVTCWRCRAAVLGVPAKMLRERAAIEAAIEAAR